MTQPRALIIGSGIAGPVTAIALQRVGFDVTLVEAKPALSSEGAFLGIAPNGLAALATLGLDGTVIAHGHACKRFEFVNRHGVSLGAIDRSADRARFGHALTMVRRATLHRTLASACEARGIVARFDHKLVDFVRGAHAIEARFEHGAKIEAEVVIGCDGLRSRSRALITPDAASPRSSGLLDMGGFSSPVDVPFEDGVNHMVFGRRAFFGAFREPSGSVWWFHNGPPAEDHTGHRERLHELHRDDPAWVRAVIDATPTLLGPWPLSELGELSRWSDDRVCLLGDAAHAMSPSAGQGASLAIEDAIVLAQCLRDGFVPEFSRDSTVSPARAFARFERERKPRVDEIARVARRNSNNKALSPVGAWFRDKILPIVLPKAGEQQSKAYAFSIDWDASMAGP